MNLGSVNQESCTDWTNEEVDTEISNVLVDSLYYCSSSLTTCLASQDHSKRDPYDVSVDAAEAVVCAIAIDVWNRLQNPHLEPVRQYEYERLLDYVGAMIFKRAARLMSAYNSDVHLNIELQTRMITRLGAYNPDLNPLNR